MEWGGTSGKRTQMRCPPLTALAVAQPHHAPHTANIRTRCTFFCKIRRLRPAGSVAAVSAYRLRTWSNGANLGNQPHTQHKDQAGT